MLILHIPPFPWFPVRYAELLQEPDNKQRTYPERRPKLCIYVRATNTVMTSQLKRSFHVPRGTQTKDGMIVFITDVHCKHNYTTNVHCTIHKHNYTWPYATIATS